MKRSEVRDFIKSGIDAVATNIRFNSGRLSEFNSNRSNEYPFVWLESLSSSTEFSVTQMPFDEWNIVLHVANKNAADDKPEQYEAIIDACDEIAQKLVYQYNQSVNGYKLATITGIERSPFVHKHADRTAGVVLSFTLNSPDKTDVC